ncbi:MAG: RNA polymerase sigma factor [Archangiaceae bacterium]|nr:RNA polymerase sigma factor [Archangiaceae bacterium]
MTGADVDGVAQLKRGDAQAFERAFARYQPGLLRFLRRLTQHDATALELTQDTWLKLAEEAPWLRDDTVLRAWLFTVARNLFLSHRRWSLLDGSRLDQLLSWGQGRRDEQTPEASASTHQEQQHVSRAFGQLPLKYREALALVAGEGFEPSEAALVLGIKPEAFRQRLSRAREQLKAMMERDEK